VTRRRRVAAGIAVLVAAGCTTTAVVVARDDEPGRAAIEAPAVSAPRSSSTTTVAPTTTTLPPLPVPDDSPADPYADVPVTEIGAISIPKLGLDHVVYEGVWLTVLNVGPGHWPNSSMPGQRGNTVFPGHRTTYSRPFEHLDDLGPGDDVIFRMPDGDHVYRVRETVIVAPTDMWVVSQTETSTFTLIACHPKGSAAERIVVKGDYVASYPATRAIGGPV
jgi:sortase A